MIDIISLRGTGEPLNGPTNMLTVVTAALDPTRHHLLGDCDYPASVGPDNPQGNPAGVSETTSVTVGLANLVAMIRAATNPVGVIGYSLGALVVTALREAQARGEYSDCEVAFTACMANPRRHAGDSIDPNPYGFGIAGQRGPISDVPHFEAANPADAITSCNPDSPLRTLADGLGAFSFADLGGWSLDLATRFRQQKFQPASCGWWMNPVRTWKLYEEAARNIEGYLSGRTHIRDYIEGGYCTRLAAAINERAGA